MQKAKKVKNKEIRFKVHIGEHDLQTKLNSAKKFLDKNMRIKVTISFHPRQQMAQLQNLLDEFVSRFRVIGKLMTDPVIRGNKYLFWLVKK